jgi:Putative DNA-binding domain
VVVGPKSKAAVKRYNVYRNNVTVSLINALAAAFPATLRITGVDFFRAMARLRGFRLASFPPAATMRSTARGVEEAAVQAMLPLGQPCRLSGIRNA